MIRTSFAAALAIFDGSRVTGPRVSAAGRCREAVRHRSFRKHRATRRRSGASTARCATSTRSGTSHRRKSSRRPSRLIRNAASPIGESRSGLLLNPHVPPSGEEPGRRGCHDREGQKRRRPKASARRDFIDALAVIYADHEKVSAWRACPEPSQGDGDLGGALSERRRDADLIRHRAQRRSLTERQDLRQPA